MLLDLGGAGQNLNRLGFVSDINEGSGRIGRAANLPVDDEDYNFFGRHKRICHHKG